LEQLLVVVVEMYRQPIATQQEIS